MGLAWNTVKQPEFVTKTHRAVSGFERRAAFMAYPLWTFKLSYEFLRDGNFGTDYDSMVGFFLARYGSFDSFLYSDPTDNSITNQPLGLGNGTKKTFQLLRNIGNNAFTEPVENVNTIVNVNVDGTPTTDYTVSSTGVITFNTAPANGADITWSGTYYYRCRFVQDVSEFSRMMQDLWELKKLEFVGSTMNKV